MCVVAIISPFIVLATGFFESHITYSSNCGGVVLDGQLDQYGKKGRYASTINVVVKPYFKFISWDDGSLETERNDVFENQDKDYVALGKIDLEDLDVFQFKCSSQEISYSLSKKEFSFFQTKSDVSEDKEMLIRILPNFENVKMQSTKDFYIESSKSIFKESDSKKWTLLSMRNDKTKIHNLLAYSILNSTNNNILYNRFFRFVNVVFEDSYLGVYMAVESSDDYYQRCFGEKIDWEITINNLPSSTIHDYFNTFCYDVIFNNTRMSSSQIAQQLFKFLSNSNGWSVSDFDKASLMQYMSINQLLKNNAGTSNDLRIFKLNGKYYFDSFISYSISSPLFSWFDVGHTGNVRYHQFIENIYANLSNPEEDLGESIKTMNDSLQNSIKESNNYLDGCHESILADEAIVIPGNDDYFGLPIDLKQLSRTELIIHYLSWINDRSNWISNTYK